MSSPSHFYRGPPLLQGRVRGSSRHLKLRFWTHLSSRPLWITSEELFGRALGNANGTRQRKLCKIELERTAYQSFIAVRNRLLCLHNFYIVGNSGTKTILRLN